MTQTQQTQQSAHIEDGVVTNVIVGTLQGHIPCSQEVGKGWLYNEASQTFSPPGPESLPPLTVEERLDEQNFVRDENINAGFLFRGHRYQSRTFDLERMHMSMTAALVAIQAGHGIEGNLRWHNSDQDFFWIDASNTKVAMDAPTLVALGQVAVAHVQGHVLASRTAKDRILAEQQAGELSNGSLN